MNPEFPKRRMTASVNITEFDSRMNSSEEGTVEPTTTLRDEFGDLVRDVGNGVGGFNVVKDPLTITLGDEFPAEDLVGNVSQLSHCHERRSHVLDLLRGTCSP